MRVIDALLRSDVQDGSTWIALPLPGGKVLPSQTLGVNPRRGRMYWCDRVYDPRAVAPTHFGSEAALVLPQLLGECTLVEAVSFAPRSTPRIVP